MKKRLGLAIAASVWCAFLQAQGSPTPSAHRGKATPAVMESVTGTVKKYTAGKTLVIVGSDGKSRSLVVDGTTRIDGPIARGQSVTAVWMTDSAGKKKVSAISTSPRIGEIQTASASPQANAPGTAAALSPTPTDETTPAPSGPSPTPTPARRSEEDAAPPPRPTPRVP